MSPECRRFDEVTMAAIQRATSLPDLQPREAESAPSLARGYLTRLSQLHDEAAKTALLANLLGRAPYVAAAVAASAFVTVALAASTAPVAELATWLVLVAAGIGVGARAYAKAIRAPFELGTLQGFAGDLSATLVYAGFAFGAGAMLVLPANVSLMVLLAFGVGTSALIGAVLGVRDMTLCFLVPAVTLSAFAAILRPFQGGLVDMTAMLVAGAAAVAAVQIAERLAVRPRVPDLAGLPVG
jgi:hypothetical protein